MNFVILIIVGVIILIYGTIVEEDLVAISGLFILLLAVIQTSTDDIIEHIADLKKQIKKK